MFVFCFMKNGLFVVVDGLDGIGKGVIESELQDMLESPVFDSIQWCKENPDKRPSLDLLFGYKSVLTGEPTYSLLGRDIRDYFTAKENEGVFTADELIQAYSLDRHLQMALFVVPALEAGYDVIQSRSFATTLCYQTLNAEDEGRNVEETKTKILEHPGNRYEITYAPDLLIIPTIGDISKLIERLDFREKKDNTIFENDKFLRRAKPFYESSWLKEIFENAKTKVAYLDAGISIDSTRKQAGEIFESFLENGDFPSKYKSSKFD